MGKSDIEIEIKLPLINPDSVKVFLSKNAQSLSSNEYQKDTYYTPSHRDFLAVKYPYEWLRLRQSDKGASITYKHFYPENAKVTDYCDEFETDISTPSSVEKIFAALDFQELVVVEKTRSSTSAVILSVISRWSVRT